VSPSWAARSSITVERMRSRLRAMGAVRSKARSHALAGETVLGAGAIASNELAACSPRSVSTRPGIMAVTLPMAWPHQLPGITNRQLRNEINSGRNLIGGKLFATEQQDVLEKVTIAAALKPGCRP
jgi:hypothetical protein